MNKPLVEAGSPQAPRIVQAELDAPEPDRLLRNLLHRPDRSPGQVSFQRGLLRSAAGILDVDAMAIVADDGGKLTIREMALDARHNVLRGAMASELRLAAGEALLHGSAADASECIPGATVIASAAARRPVVVAAIKSSSGAELGKAKATLELVAFALGNALDQAGGDAELPSALLGLGSSAASDADTLVTRVQDFSQARHVYLCDESGRVLSASPPVALKANGPLAQALKNLVARAGSAAGPVFQRRDEADGELAALLQAELAVALRAGTGPNGPLVVVVDPARALGEAGWTLVGLILAAPANQRPGTMNWRRKGVIGAAIVAALAAGAMFVPVPDRIRADAAIEPDGRRFVTAGFAAVVQSTTVAPGDVVRQGQAVATLEGEAIVLAREAAEARVEEASRKQDAALRGKQATEAELARIEGDAATADRDLLDWQIKQLILKSPVDGVVLENRFEHSSGAPVREGDEIVQIAPLDTLRVRIDVPVVDLERVPEEIRAEIHLDGVAGDPIILDGPTKAVRAEVVNGQTVVPLRGTIANIGDRLRPGFSGVATIPTGSAPLGAVLFRHAWQAAQRWWL